MITNILLTILGMLTIIAAVVSVFVVLEVAWWSALGGIMAGFVLVNLRGDEATKFINKMLDTASNFKNK